MIENIKICLISQICEKKQKIMKKHLLILLLLSFIIGFSQNLDLIKKEVEKINNTKNFKIKTIPNDYFVDIKNEATDNGQELKGYYDKNQLKKIIHFVGLSAWNIVTEYYYKDNQLIFVLNSKYQSVSENGFLEKPKFLYRNRYYFKNNKLIKKIEEETSETFDFIKLSNELKKDLKKTGNREKHFCFSFFMLIFRDCIKILVCTI